MGPIYVYGVVPAEEDMAFDTVGVDGDGGPVYAVPHHGIAAVVSTSPLENYRALGRQEAVTYLVAHQRVVEAVMRERPVLPVRFGTVLADAGVVQRLLAVGEARFTAALAEIADRVQMEVVVLWDLQEVFGEIAQQDEIAQFRAQIAARPAEAMVAERMAMGQKVHASLLERRAALQSQLLPALRNVARDVVVNPPMDDSMVVNAALLLDPTDDGALDQELERLDQAFDGRLHLRCVGPLPPYSFATVEIVVPSFEAVDKARQTLGLCEVVRPAKIRQAYHRLAAQSHPDHRPDDSAAESRMAELADAYALLNAYTEAQALEGGISPEGGDASREALCHLDRATAERTLLISVRRQELCGGDQA